MYNDFFYERKANTCSPKHTRYSSDGYITLILDKENISMAYVWNGWCINYQHNVSQITRLLCWPVMDGEGGAFVNNYGFLTSKLLL